MKMLISLRGLILLEHKLIEGYQSLLYIYQLMYNRVALKEY